jgi:N-acetylglucosamine-6-phosphate deacetylase
MIEPSLHAVVADHVFEGAAVHESAAVIMHGTRIAEVVPRGDVPRTISVRVLPEGAWLAPGFIDLQVNGGGDVLFNDQPTLEGVCKIAAAHRKFGTTGTAHKAAGGGRYFDAHRAAQWRAAGDIGA